MITDMLARLSPKTYLAFVIAGAILFAGSALYFAITQGDNYGPLLRHVLSNQAMITILVWSVVALGARWLTVGKLPKSPQNSTTVIWGASRLSLLIAVVLLMIGTLIALAFNLAPQLALFRAFVFLLVVTGLTGIAGGAFYNSMLAVRHWSGPNSE